MTHPFEKTVHKVGLNKGITRIFIEGSELQVNKINRGEKFFKHFVDGKLILDFFADESIRKNTVSKRGEMPVIDLTGKKIVETFGKYSHFEAIYKNRNSEKTITIKPIK